MTNRNLKIFGTLILSFWILTYTHQTKPYIFEETKEIKKCL